MSAEVKNILYVRTDSIGDNVLAAPMLPYICKKFNGAKITVVCQKHIAELYEACPFVDNIITFDKKLVLKFKLYELFILKKLRSLKPDMSLNPLYSRDSVSDMFTLQCGARRSIALEGDLSNIPAWLKCRNDRFYTQLLPSRGKHKPECERHRDFLRGLGIEAGDLHPTVWLTAGDEKYAENFFRKNNLKPENTVILSPGAQYSYKIYPRFGYIPRDLKNFNFIILGDKETKVMARQICKDAAGKCFDLSGRTTIRQMAAIIRKSCLCVGVDSACTHIACAVGTPNVIIVGGGHFGRFLPYSTLTSLVCLPLDCYGCNWRCRYNDIYCIRSILPEIIAEAVHKSRTMKAEKPRIFVQSAAPFNSADRPNWKLFDEFVDIDKLDIITLAGQGGRFSRASK